MFSEDLVSLITAAGLGTLGTSLFVGSKATFPVGDGPYTSVIETGGTAPEGTHNMVDRPAYVRPSAQIVVRAKKRDDARNRIQSLYLMLYPVRDRFVNGTWWRSVTIVQEPFDLGVDDAGRIRFAFNINVVKRLDPASS